MTNLPAGYGVWLNDNGTWYVQRGYREHDGRQIRDGLPHAYATRWSAYRAAWKDFGRRDCQPGNVYPVTTSQVWASAWELGCREQAEYIRKHGIPF